MALPLLAIGNAVPGGLSVKIGAGPSKALFGGASFGSQLKAKLDGSIGTDGSDVLSQLAALLQAGTPMATIIDRIAKTLSSALASATGSGGNTVKQRTLERALAGALAPPGAGPPASDQQRVASLERRLGNLLSTLTRALQKDTAGQQNRFSGPVLDANSAKEIPAQQTTNDPNGTAPSGSLALAESILRGVLQQLNAAAPQPAQITAQSALQAAPAQAAQPIAVQSADVLGRMLARAAKADPSATPAAPQSATAASPSDLFTRLMTVIAEASNDRSAPQHDGKQSPSFTFKDASPATHTAQPAANASPVSGFASAVSTAAAPAGQPPPASAAAYAADPQSVIEQIVKGLVVRNFGTTSEVRMRLQPEHLGDVSLKLTVTGTTISANIVAQNADVRDMLVQNQQQLVRTLAEAGLSLGNFSVDVSGGNPGFSQQQTQHHRSLSKAAALQADASAEDEAWADSRFGPPIISGAKSLVLNYLA